LDEKGGKVYITIISAKNLPSADSNGLSDPYVTIGIVGQKSKSKLKTQTIKKTLNPTWNEKFELDVPSINTELIFDVFDWDRFGKDDELGSVTVIVETLLDPPNTTHELNLELKSTKSGSSRGHLRVDLTFVEADLVKEIGNNFAKSKFVGSIKHQLVRDYILIIDKSGSMAGSYWKQAQKAVSKLAPCACQADPDGVTLYFFTSNFTKYENIKDASTVENIFQKERPSDSTNLAGVLKAAFQEHFAGNKPTTILVITDGSPDSESDVISEITDTSNRLEKDEDLSLTFIQIGNDSGATKFLKKLDESLSGIKFDIVDTITQSDMEGMSFNEIIEASISD